MAVDLNRSAKTPEQVRRLFDELAPRYELADHLFSLGLDAWWRRQAARRLAPEVAGPLLDGATGSGQLAIALARRYPDRTVIGLDFSAGMLAVGRRRVAAAGLADRVRLVESDLTALPFPDASFAGATAAFGVRNVADRRACLAELRRVLRPRARVLLLEFAMPTAPVIAPLYRWYFGAVMPRLAGLIGARETYRYLFRSVQEFPAEGEFTRMLREAGFADVKVTPMTLGTVKLYEGGRVSSQSAGQSSSLPNTSTRNSP